MSIVESLKKLVEPIVARATQQERLAMREQPKRDGAGSPPSSECRVCGYQGTDPAFCPECLAGTMRPSSRAAPAATSALAESAAPARQPEPIAEIPLNGTLDLHTFNPAEVKQLVPEYLAACAAHGLREVRVVHGKGTGQLRRTVAALLAREPLVESFRAADESAGGWGATLVTLRPPSARVP